MKNLHELPQSPNRSILSRWLRDDGSVVTYWRDGGITISRQHPWIGNEEGWLSPVLSSPVVSETAEETDGLGSDGEVPQRG